MLIIINVIYIFRVYLGAFTTIWMTFAVNLSRYYYDCKPCATNVCSLQVLPI